MDSPSTTPSCDNVTDVHQFRDDLWAAACVPPSPSFDEDGVQWAEAAAIPVSTLTSPPHTCQPQKRQGHHPKNAAYYPQNPRLLLPRNRSHQQPPPLRKRLCSPPTPRLSRPSTSSDTTEHSLPPTPTALKQHGVPLEHPPSSGVPPPRPNYPKYFV